MFDNPFVMVRPARMAAPYLANGGERVSRRKLNSVEPLESRRLLTVLTFDPVSANAAVLPTTYGDRITTASKAGFIYGAAGGITPGITVSYGPDAANVRQWKDGYGDLHNVLFAGDSAKGILDITLSADLGSQVNLASLDLGGGANTDYTINSFSIFDGGSNVLFTQSNLKVEGDANGALHTHLDFSSIHSRVLRIHIDASNLGTNGDQIGVDNIQFSQLDTASPVGDGYADVVLNYHDSGVGPIPAPMAEPTPMSALNRLALASCSVETRTSRIIFLFPPVRPSRLDSRMKPSSTARARIWRSPNWSTPASGPTSLSPATSSISPSLASPRPGV